MFLQRLKDSSDLSIRQRAGHFLLHQIDRFTLDLRQDLDQQIDSRLVRTFYDLLVTILMFRHRQMGLLLSELGGWVCGFDHAPAGTKRISNLLRSPKWSSRIIDDFFWHRTKDRIAQLCQTGKRPLMLWDDSRIEKPESWKCEGLCSVWSSKGKRLTRIKKGYYHAISRICVPGFKWTGVFLSHIGGVPSVCQMSWWTTRGKYKEDPDNIIFRLLRKVHEQVGRSVVHVLDRGYASEKMLRYLFVHQQDFIIRWKKNHLLIHPEKGCKKTHLIARSFKGKSQRIVRDKMRKQHKCVSISWGKVFHPEFPDNQLFLVIIRDRKNYNSPMYIITSIPIEHQGQAWEVMYCYMHRWEAEQSFRFLKSEMGIEAPRLWFWDNRMKLLGIVTIAYEFLLSMMRNWKTWAMPFMKTWCHGTGERYRNASIPLYRFRMAISNCLLMLWTQNSG